MGSNFAVLPSEFGEENTVRQPRAARNTRGHHKYDPTVVDNKVVGYVALPYEFQAYPKMLFHPEYGSKPQPEISKFSVGCVTPEQYQNAVVAYQEALGKWQRENRTRTVLDEKEEKRLIAKGWLAKPPQRKQTSTGFDLNSDEL